MKNGIPRGYMKENYAKMLLVVHKYFTCEGRFHMVYSYHFRLLLHFIGKKPLDLPFFSFITLGNISDKVHAKAEGSETSVFHQGLIRLLVLEELKRLNRNWASFLFMSGYEVYAVTPVIIKLDLIGC